MKRKKWYLLMISILLFSNSSCFKEIPERPPAETIFVAPITGGCENTNYVNWETSAYVLPYPVGTSYVVNLSHCSGSYHSAGQPDQFAIDFAMTIATQITASRSGEVVHIEESGADGGFPNNVVVVKHGDGTFGQYMHLTQNGARVSKGQQVEQGDLIGLSGSTGLAGYPHLHFVVTRSGSFEYPYTSVPTTFSNTIANVRSLQQGRLYEALSY